MSRSIASTAASSGDRVRGSRCRAGRRAATLATLAILCAAFASLRARALTIDTGHQGAITSLVVEPRRNLLASASADGAVRIWDLARGRQEAVLPVSRSPVQRLALHPEAPLVAAVESTGRGAARISVWDWATRACLYTIDLPDAPLYLGFSTLGTYLAYTRADRQSIQLRDARTGAQLPYMRRSFGIVSFLAFSRTERNLMAYQPSGRISYWEIRTGEMLKEVGTAADLEPARISEDLSKMVARSPRGGIAVVDVATGVLLAEAGGTEVLALDASPDGSRIFALATSGARASLHQWTYSYGILSRQDVSEPLDLGREGTRLTCLAIDDRAVYLGDGGGSLYQLPFAGPLGVLSSPKLAPALGVAVSGRRIAVATGGVLWLFQLEPRDQGMLSQGSQGSQGPPAASFVGYRSQRVDLSGYLDPNPCFLDDQTLAVWDRAGRRLDLVYLAVENARSSLEPYAIRRVPESLFSSNLLQVGPGGAGRLLVLESEGAIQLIDRETLASLYRYVAPGTRAVAWVAEGVLVGARSRLSRLEHPLLRIDTRTGETVPLPDNTLLSYDLAPDQPAGRFFSLDLEATSPNVTTTAVRVHEGPGLESSRVVMRHTGEDSGASIALDAETGRLYSTLGLQGVQVWQNGRATRLEISALHVPRRLAASRDLVVAVNHDRTATVWEAATGRLLADFYLFADSTWLAVLRGGEQVISEGADRYLLPD